MCLLKKGDMNMNSDQEIKKIVKEKYAEIALATSKQPCCDSSDETSCCGSQNKKVIAYSMINDDYSKLDGYVADADLNLGCGLPTEFAGIKKGDTVIDLGSGAGNDVFIARSIVGESGKVIGLDFTEEMLAKANQNKEKLGYKNIEFKLGEIEQMPFENNAADVVVSNCVLNLVPDKKKAFAEIYRILKPGAHFCVSDIVIKGELNPELRKSAAMYAGCVAGALKQEEYLDIIKQSGFQNVEIKKTKRNDLPDDLLKNYLDEEGIKSYKEKVEGIFSITVVGYKK